MPSPGLRFALCDVWGAVLADLTEHTNGKVEIELDAPCTSECKLSVFDPKLVAGVPALTRIVKTWLGSQLVATNILLDPEWDGGQGEVTLSAQDGWLRLDRAYLHSYFVVSPTNLPGGMTFTDVYRNLWQLAASRNYPLGAPPLGIIVGTEQYTGLANEHQYLNYEPGTNVGDKLRELDSTLGAPEIQLQPLDRIDGYHWQFNSLAGASGTYGQGTDRSDTVVFYFNCVNNNAADSTYAPSGEPVRNTTTVSGAPLDDGTLDPNPQYSVAVDQVTAAGFYEDWISTDQSDVNVKLNMARYNTTAYANPPDMFTVVPAPEGGSELSVSPPRFGIDYFVGDTIRVVGRKGVMAYDVKGRVRKATLEEQDNREVKVSLEVAPDTRAVVVT